MFSRTPQPLRNHLLVRVEADYNNVLKHNSLELIVDPDFDQAKYAQRYCTVLSVPRQYVKTQFGEWVNPEVKVGDKLFVHYHAINEDFNVDEKTYLIPTDYVIAILKDGVIHPVNGRVLCTPIFDNTDVDYDNELGSYRKTKSGIIYEINVSHDLKAAKLSHFGKPMNNGKNLNLHIRTDVVYEKDADFSNNILGKEYFVMSQIDLMMEL